MRAGDSIYSIARKHGIRPEDIAAVNGIGDVTKVKFGQVLKMPGSHATARPLAGLQPTLKPRADGEILHLVFLHENHLHPQRLKDLLAEHLRGFRETFGK